MNQPWALPYSTSQINDRDPGHQGPSCQACAAYQADRRERADKEPLVHGSDNKLYKSPHVGTYLFEARYSRWACTQGAHGPLDPYDFRRLRTANAENPAPPTTSHPRHPQHFEETP